MNLGSESESLAVCEVVMLVLVIIAGSDHPQLLETCLEAAAVADTSGRPWLPSRSLVCGYCGGRSSGDWHYLPALLPR